VIPGMRKMEIPLLKKSHSRDTENLDLFPDCRNSLVGG
jgi:hypothetical protein